MKKVMVTAVGALCLVFASIVLLSCQTSPAAENDESDGGGQEFWDFELVREESGHWYRPIYDTLTWSGAKLEAEAQGGYLIVPEDLAENEWLVAEFGPEAGGFWRSDRSSVHLGLSDHEEEGVWKPVNSDMEIPFDNWAAEEHWAELSLEGGGWNDVPDWEILPAIVEFNTDPADRRVSVEL